MECSYTALINTCSCALSHLYSYNGAMNTSVNQEARNGIKLVAKTIIMIIQVNKNFYKLERVYRDCIKITRDKTRIYSILRDAPGT